MDKSQKTDRDDDSPSKWRTGVKHLTINLQSIDNVDSPLKTTQPNTERKTSNKVSFNNMFSHLKTKSTY